MRKRCSSLRLGLIAALTVLIVLSIPSVSHAAACHTYPAAVGKRVTVKHKLASLHQRRMLARILNLATRMKATRRVKIAAIAATTQEASATNLPRGHGTSVGLFQLISVHGSFQWRMVPENSAGWFLRGAIRTIRQRPGLDAAQLAQAVERSAHPSAYRAWLSEARLTYWHYLQVCR